LILSLSNFLEFYYKVFFSVKERFFSANATFEKKETYVPYLAEIKLFYLYISLENNKYF